MSLAVKRDKRGLWQKGQSGNPTGIAGRSKGVKRRPEYLDAMMSECTLDEWRAITRRAIDDAIDGKASARNWLSSYILGPPGAYSQQQDDTLPIGTEREIVRLTAILERATISTPNQDGIVDSVAQEVSSDE